MVYNVSRDFFCRKVKLKNVLDLNSFNWTELYNGRKPAVSEVEPQKMVREPEKYWCS